MRVRRLAIRCRYVHYSGVRGASAVGKTASITVVESKVFELLLLFLNLCQYFLRHNRFRRVLVDDVGVEVAYKVLIWLELGRYLSLQQFLQIEALKEFVAKDFFSVALLAQTLLAVFEQEHRYQVLGFLADADFVFDWVGPSQWGLLDELVHLVLVLVIKGRNAYYHFVDQDAQGPPVQGVVVARADDHLRRNVLGRAAERVGLRSVIDLVDLGQAEVGEEDVAIKAQQNVLGLEVPVIYIGLVEVAEGESDLGGIELHPLLAKAPLLRQVLEQLAALHELHHEVDARLGGEHLLHGDNERVLHLQKDQLLNLQTLERLVLYNDVLADALHRKVLVGVNILDQVNFSEGAPADMPDDLIVFKLKLGNVASAAVGLATEHALARLIHLLVLVGAPDRGLPSHRLLHVLNILEDIILVVDATLEATLVVDGHVAVPLIAWRLASGDLLVREYVLLNKPGEVERQPIMTFLRILLSCYKHLQVIRFLYPKYLQIVSLYTYVRNLQCIYEVISSVKIELLVSGENRSQNSFKNFRHSFFQIKLQILFANQNKLYRNSLIV